MLPTFMYEPPSYDSKRFICNLMECFDSSEEPLAFLLILYLKKPFALLSQLYDRWIPQLN